MPYVFHRRDDIQVLRAVAVLGVIGYHYFPSVIKNGYLGVDLFFLLSGFVITGLLVRSESQGSLIYSRFIFGRVRRLLPALIFVIGTVTTFALLLLDADRLRLFAISAISALTYTSNFYFSLTSSDYWAPEASFTPLLHTWSLGVEQFFYIFYPFLFIYVASKRRIRALTFICFASACSYILLTTNESWSEIGFYWPSSRIWEIILGCLAFFLREKLSKNHRLSLNGFSFILVIACISWNFYFNLSSALALPITCLLTLLLLVNQAPITIATRFLKRIGDMSYSLYLWHWPLISFAVILFGRKPPLSITLVLILITLVFSYLTYEHIEKKYNSPKTRATKIFVPLTTLLTLLVITSSLSSWPQSINIKAIQDIKSTERAPMTDAICRSETKKYLNSDYCKFKETKFQNVMAVTGDSHADIAFEGLQTLSTNLKSSVLLIANSNCPTLLGVSVGSGESSRICSADSLDAVNFIASNPNIDRVLIVIRGSYYITGQDYINSPIDRKSLLAESEPVEQISRITALQKSLVDTVKRYSQAGKRVYILTENPEMSFHPLYCLTQFVKFFATCTLPTQEAVRDRTSNYSGVISTIPNAKVIDITYQFCEKYCKFELAEALLYSDNDHLSQYGARIQARNILKQLGDL